jgi:hypothetical protein
MKKPKAKRLRLRAWARVDERGRILKSFIPKAATQHDFGLGGGGISVMSSPFFFVHIEGTHVVPVSVVLESRK